MYNGGAKTTPSLFKNMKHLLPIAFLLSSFLFTSCQIRFVSDSASSQSGDEATLSDVEPASEESVEETTFDSEEESTSEETSQDSGYVPENYSLLWSDEFDGDTLSHENWECMIGNGNEYGIWGWGNNEQQYYKSENAVVKDGALHIETYLEDQDYLETTYHYTSARIRSKGKFAFTYGYIEARIQMCDISGIWPAFWMLPEERYKDMGWPTSGELDIMEARGRQSDRIGGTVHSASASGSDAYHGGTYLFPEGEDITSYHTYAMKWTSEAIYFYVDGVRYYNLACSFWQNNNPNYEGSAPFDRDFHILLNQAVGGNYDNNVMPPKDFSECEMLVDYVRVYQENL